MTDISKLDKARCTLLMNRKKTANGFFYVIYQTRQCQRVSGSFRCWFFNSLSFFFLVGQFINLCVYTHRKQKINRNAPICTKCESGVSVVVFLSLRVNARSYISTHKQRSRNLPGSLTNRLFEIFTSHTHTFICTYTTLKLRVYIRCVYRIYTWWKYMGDAVLDVEEYSHVWATST